MSASSHTKTSAVATSAALSPSLGATIVGSVARGDDLAQLVVGKFDAVDRLHCQVSCRRARPRPSPVDAPQARPRIGAARLSGAVKPLCGANPPGFLMALITRSPPRPGCRAAVSSSRSSLLACRIRNLYQRSDKVSRLVAIPFVAPRIPGVHVAALIE
jgi:hypothetical protein